MQFDFGYTELFYIPGVKSAFISSCDRVVGDSLEFNQANQGSLRVCLGKHNCSGHNTEESGFISWRGESLMSFLELRQELGVYSRVTAGMSIRNWSCSVKSGHMSMYQGYLRNINNAWQDNTNASGS